MENIQFLHKEPCSTLIYLSLHRSIMQTLILRKTLEQNLRDCVILYKYTHFIYAYILYAIPM